LIDSKEKGFRESFFYSKINILSTQVDKSGSYFSKNLFCTSDLELDKGSLGP
jgi:hypothetical protein